MAFILLVEDDETTAALVGQLLEDAGHQVKVSGDPIEALEWLEEFRPDLVLCDLWLPGMSGAEFRREMDKRAETTRIPVVLLTGVSRSARGDTSMFDAVVEKPFELDALLNTIDQVLEQPR